MQNIPGLSPEEAWLISPDIDEDKVRASWPSTLDQAVTRLIDEMDEADKKTIRDTKKEDLISFHHGWGTGIRKESGSGGATPTCSPTATLMILTQPQPS